MPFLLPRRNRRRFGLIAVLALMVVMSGIARGDWRFDADSGVVYNNNLSNSDRDFERDYAWDSNLRAANGTQLTRNLRMTLSAELHSQAWASFRDFNNFRPAGSLAMRYRFGLGPTAPWLGVDDQLGYAFFGDKDRSGLENRFQVGGGIGFTDRLAFEAGYVFENFEARDAFWDWSGHIVLARLSYDVTSSLQIALGYSFRNGDVISYALPPRPDIVAIRSEQETVDTFGFPNYNAYKLRGSTNAVSISGAYTITKYLSFQLLYEYRNTFHHPLEYENHVFEAKIAFAY
jgi:hypothetical protein